MLFQEVKFNYLLTIFGVLLLVLSARIQLTNSEQYYGSSSISHINSIRNNPRWNNAPMTNISGNHISIAYYLSGEATEQSKEMLQQKLQNFLENLQRNLTISNVLNAAIIHTNSRLKIEHQVTKLFDLADFFETASDSAGRFAKSVDGFFELMKNESNVLLLRLRKIPSGHRLLPMRIKLQLTDYFSEMEFFHIMFSETIDVALEYIVATLRATQRTFIHYADLQRDALRKWKSPSDDWCCSQYIDFFHQLSSNIFKCAAGVKLNVAYDVFAITKVTTKHILQQMEFRVQRLFNCFRFENYELHCRFLLDPEKDFQKLFDKLDELQMYYDIKTKGGRVTTYRHRRHRSQRHTPTTTIHPSTLNHSNAFDGKNITKPEQHMDGIRIHVVNDTCLPDLFEVPKC